MLTFVSTLHVTESTSQRFSVPHDRLFLDALERDLKREKQGLEATTHITGEPALSFVYDSKKSLFEQFSKASGGVVGEGELEAAVRRADELLAFTGSSDVETTVDLGPAEAYSRGPSEQATDSGTAVNERREILSMFSVDTGAGRQDYKTRASRRKTGSRSRNASADQVMVFSLDDENESRLRSKSIVDDNPEAGSSWPRKLTSRMNNAARKLTSPYPPRNHPLPAIATTTRSRSHSNEMDVATILAYRCPLLTCQRVFKYPQDLKKHHSSQHTLCPYRKSPFLMKHQHQPRF